MKTFFNDVFEIKCTKETKQVIETSEFIASVERIPVSIDCLVTSILLYYENEQYKAITQLYSAVEYYSQLKKEQDSSVFHISFSEINKESITSYVPDITGDVLNLFKHIRSEYDYKINVSELFLEIVSFCFYNRFEQKPILINDENMVKFGKLYCLLKQETNCSYNYQNQKEDANVLYGTDITHKAYSGNFDPIIGRTTELQHIMRILSKRTKNNPLLVGEPGVGKTHIIEALAYMFVKGDVPKRFQGKKIIQLNISEVISGTRYRGDLEEHFQAFMEDVQKIDAIIFIDEIHLLFKSKDFSLADILKQHLLDTNCCVIGVTTPKELKLVEKDPAFKRRFDIVRIDEPSLSEAKEILTGLKGKYESFHSVTISDTVIDTVLNLSSRYIQSSKLPDKALDILDEACAQLEITGTSTTLSDENIYAIITEKTHIPVSNLKSLDTTILLNLENLLNQRVIGQQQAIASIVKALKRSKVDIQDNSKPIASFLFAGTTGVGKTETAKALAKEYFGKTALIRFDMSEYQTQETIHRLTGASPGYVGYDEGGQLTNAVRNTPYSVVLFDEIEKAHPDVLNILLQILDDGRLTDSFGITVDFRNTIIILTTNLGARAVQKDHLGFGESTNSDNNSAFLSEIKKTLKPELINRLNQIIIYNELSKSDCEKIVQLYINELKERLRIKGINLHISNNISPELIRRGYNKTYGARELKRTFENLVLDPIADFILINGNRLNDIFIDQNFSITKTKKEKKEKILV